MTQIAERTALSWNTILYHLRILKRTGQVDVHKDGRDRAVFPNGVPPRQRLWMLALRDDQARAVLHTLLESPQNVPALSRRLGYTEKVVRGRLLAFAKAGLLRKHGRWRPLYEVARADLEAIVTLLASLDARKPSPIVGSWEWDLVRDRAVLSPGGWTILGLAPSVAKSSKAFLRLVDSRDRASFAQMLAKAATGCDSFDYTVRVQTKKGIRYLRHQGRLAARDSEGRAKRFRGTIEDVTEIMAFNAPWPGPPTASEAEGEAIRERPPPALSLPREPLLDGAPVGAAGN
ncbi:MAG TPA: hypothetical protein VJ874_00595 [Candidatus Thermoplasmatota archaeon]|nr:hypothetical protein [Candidatus Thermoplasmatota archaeon]